MLQLDSGRNEMTAVPQKTIEILLEEGPFPRAIVESWSVDLQADYFELLGLDLESLGLDEFRRMGRALGEAYLMSLDRPIDSDPKLLEAWKVLTGDVCPPDPPKFELS